MAVNPTATDGVAARLADFAARLRRELGQPLSAIDLNAALLLRDLCEAWPLSAEQQARVLGDAPDVVAVEDAALEDRSF